MTETLAKPARKGFDRQKLDLWLTLSVWVLLIALLAFTAYFVYTVRVIEERKQSTNAPSRVISALESQVRTNPDDVILRVRLGEAYGSARRFPEAVEQFKAALQIDPEHVGAYLDLGMVAMLTNRDQEAEGYFQKVIELTDKAEFSKVDDRRENAYYNLGRLMLKQQKYAEAAGYLKAALRIRKDASDTYLNLARALKGLEDYDGAITQAEYALAFDPGFAQAHFTMGELYELKGDKVNASYHFFEAARLEPDADLPQEMLAGYGPSSDWVARSQAALDKGDVDEALTDALIARNLDPGSLDAVKNHAAVLIVRKNLADALEVYLAGLKLAPEDAELKAALASLENEHPKEALAGYRAALKKNPSDAGLKKKVAALRAKTR